MTIHGSRQTGMAAACRGHPGCGCCQACWAAASQSGTGQPSASVNIRRSESSAWSSVRTSVTQTGTPAARSRSTSSRRFSSWLASTRSGRSARIAARSGFLVPRTRGTSRPAGWVHQSVAPASAAGRVTATDSVSDGTSDTTRRAGCGTETGCLRSSRGHAADPVICTPGWVGYGDIMRAITVIPGQPGSIALTEMPEPPGEDGPVLVETQAIGICGTDLEIISGEYGAAPPGADRLVIGHESLGRVSEAPAGSGFSPGDLVVGIVRRRDPLPC